MVMHVSAVREVCVSVVHVGCIAAFVCLCVRQRERDREREIEGERDTESPGV